MSLHTNKILVIATYYLPHRKNFGGATVLCSDIRSYLSDLKGVFSFYNLQESRFSAINIIRILFCPFLFLRYEKIFLMVSQNGFKFIFPYFYIFSKIFKSELILRIIGGDADLVFEQASPFLRLKHKLQRTSLIFLETKFLCEKLKYVGNIQWLPNSRQFPKVQFLPRKYSGKFIFVGRICKEKGINLIIEAFDKYLPDLRLDIYGILEKDYVPPISFIKYYRGSLPHENLIETLQKYDFMLLPTHFGGEGYPGIILESYAASTPVIASNWRSIPEIVIDGETGLLVDPFDSFYFANKILSFDQEIYNYMQEKAFNFHSFFTTDNVMKNYFLKYI